MLDTILKKLYSGTDIKGSLAELKKLLKDDAAAEIKVLRDNEFAELTDRLTAYLDDPDPKIRKNSAISLGYAAGAAGDKEVSDRIVTRLFEAYCTEQTKYNMAAYIEAIGRLDFSSVSDKLLKRRDTLIHSEYGAEDKKHILEEMRELNILLRDRIEKKHEYTGYELLNEAVLLTNRNFKNITTEELGRIPHREFNAGVMVKTKNIRKVLESRTFGEILFVPELSDEKQTEDMSEDLSEYARTLIERGLVEYLARRHSNPDAPFYFRVECKCRDIKKKSDLEKKLAGELEFRSGWRLINSTGDYDFEFRFIEGSSGKLQFLIGMRTFPDDRFDYRKDTISAGMKPSLAALLVRLSKKYIVDNAAVLDPVCGSGIFLIEREFLNPARILYGIDIYGEAVKAAQNNTKAAGMSRKTELINKDFIQFKHQYRFDEIYADMPRITAGRDSSEVERFYMEFMSKARDLLETSGHLFIFTHNRNILKRYATKFGYSVLEEFEISKVEEAYYYVLKY